MRGDPAPDGDGALFGLSVVPTLNDAGQAAFTATTSCSANTRGVFRGAGGPLTQIARAGQDVPGGDGILSFMFIPAHNEAGQTAFTATIAGSSGGTSDDTALVCPFREPHFFSFRPTCQAVAISTGEVSDGEARARRGKERFWREALAGHASSGLKTRAFCRREELAESAFHFWRRTIRQRDGQAPQAKTAPPFVPAVVTPEEPRSADFTLELAGGQVLRMAATSMEKLADLLAALAARRER